MTHTWEDEAPAPGAMLPASHDGGVELLDLLPQPPGFLLHLAPLLLQLGDVLHGLLQRDGVAGLGEERRGQSHSSHGDPACVAGTEANAGAPRPPDTTHQLGIIRDQTVEGVKAHLDVEAPFLLS